jgi:hypothetical protein
MWKPNGFLRIVIYKWWVFHIYVSLWENVSILLTPPTKSFTLSRVAAKHGQNMGLTGNPCSTTLQSCHIEPQTISPHEP